LTALTLIWLITSLDSPAIGDRLTGTVPGRIVGALLMVLGLLTLGQDATGAVMAALTRTSVPLARHVWSVDLGLEVPAMLAGGVLLFRRQSPGYVFAPGLLLQFGLTPAALAASMAVQPFLTASAIDVAAVTSLLVFAAMSFLPLAYLARSTRGT